MNPKFKLTAFLLLCSLLAGQKYTWPTAAGRHLSSNFGEFRSTGYHMGLDIKTNGKEGYPIYAVANGHIIRMSSNFVGFGKALYLETEDGKIAVYAHLSRFSPVLEKRLAKEQKNKNSYIINQYFQPQEYPVSNSEIIGYTGNTGYSSGPHLHFEIRNKAEHPLNPLTNGFPLDDRISPKLEEIALIPLEKEAWVNGSQLSQTFPLFRDNAGLYHLPDTINIYGLQGLSLKTHDKRQGASNLYQPYEFELFIDEKSKYKLSFERLDYNEMITANYVKDYSLARLNVGNFIKLYSFQNFPGLPFSPDTTLGILNLTPGYHSLRIKVKDAGDKSAEIRGTFVVKPPFEISAKVIGQNRHTLTFEIEAPDREITLNNIICYSFTAYGFADQKIDILTSKYIDHKLIITLPRTQVERHSLQFKAIDGAGAHSLPVHWEKSDLYSDHLKVGVDLKTSHTEAGIIVQAQLSQIINEDVSLQIKSTELYQNIKMKKILPSVYMSSPLPAAIFQNIENMTVLLKGDITREIQFSFPYKLVIPGTTVSVFSDDKLCSIQIADKTLADSTLIWIEAVHKYAAVEGGRLRSRVYQLQPFEIPMKSPIKVGLRYGSRLNNESNLHLYYYDKNGNWTFMDTKINRERRLLTGEIREFNAVAIIQDLTAPEILSSHPGNQGTYTAYEFNRVSIMVNDNLSGIDPAENTFSLTLDQENARFSYQPRKKEISFNLPKALEPGEHTLFVKFQDRAGNQLNKLINFKIK